MILGTSIRYDEIVDPDAIAEGDEIVTASGFASWDSMAYESRLEARADALHLPGVSVEALVDAERLFCVVERFRRTKPGAPVRR